ncbi:MAG: BatA domain-containing protein [Pacificimonas sp.]
MWLQFAFPWLLAGLAMLPVLYVILRRMPPEPRRVVLPTIVLLGEDEAPPPAEARTPWWLLLMRLLLLATLILGLAGPEWRRGEIGVVPQRIAIVIDNGWAAAPRFAEMKQSAAARLEELDGTSTRVLLLPTADRKDDDAFATRFVDPATALAQLGAIDAKAWDVDRAAAAAAIPQDSAVLWVSDDLDSDGAATLAGAGGGPREIASFPSAEPVFLNAGATATGWAVRTAPMLVGGRTAVSALSDNGTVVQSTPVDLSDGTESVRIDIPPRQRADIVRLSTGSGPASTFVVRPGTGRADVVIVEAEGGAPPLET